MTVNVADSESDGFCTWQREHSIPCPSGRFRATSQSGVWCGVRCASKPAFEDVRPHDLRPSFASHAALQGIPLPVISRLIGHKRSSKTLRHVHVGDCEAEAAAERIYVAYRADVG